MTLAGPYLSLLPNEILYGVIVQQLHPIDIARLMQTCKSMNSIRAIQSIWKLAFWQYFSKARDTVADPLNYYIVFCECALRMRELKIYGDLFNRQQDAFTRRVTDFSLIYIEKKWRLPYVPHTGKQSLKSVKKYTTPEYNKILSDMILYKGLYDTQPGQ